MSTHVQLSIHTHAYLGRPSADEWPNAEDINYFTSPKPFSRPAKRQDKTSETLEFSPRLLVVTSVAVCVPVVVRGWLCMVMSLRKEGETTESDSGRRESSGEKERDGDERTDVRPSDIWFTGAALVSEIDSTRGGSGANRPDLDAESIQREREI